MSSSSESSVLLEEEPAGSTVLEDEEELLFRQVHPAQTKPDGSPASVAFVPSERDEGLLSTHRERVGPDESYRRWTEDLQHQSVGTYGFTVGEANGAGLSAIDDETDEMPDHASVDFSKLPSKGKKTQAGRKLKEFANGRGCLHTPPET